MSSNPKLDFLAKDVLPGKTAVITTEDLDFWKTKDVVVTDKPQEAEVAILSECLQKSDDPIELLKQVPSSKIVITVPFEWGWPPEFKPFTNPAHKQQYDSELLTRHLEEAGLVYIIRIIDFNGWSFLGAEATKAE